jgi:hypothetical protein
MCIVEKQSIVVEPFVLTPNTNAAPEQPSLEDVARSILDIKDARLLSAEELATAANNAHRVAEALLEKAENDLQGYAVFGMRAGHFLIVQKARLKHGAWLPWFKANIRFSVRTGQVYMRLARSTNAQRAAFSGGRSIRAALRLLDGQTAHVAASRVYCCPQCGCTWSGHPRPRRREVPDEVAGHVEENRRTA